jgi:hypothetical protein
MVQCPSGGALQIVILQSVLPTQWEGIPHQLDPQKNNGDAWAPSLIGHTHFTHQQRSIPEVLLELAGIQCCTHDYDFQIISLLFDLRVRTTTTTTT